MKHFLLEGEHLVVPEELFGRLPQHHQFLQKGHGLPVFQLDRSNHCHVKGINPCF